MGLLMKIKIILGLLKLLKLLILSRVSGQVRLELRDSAEFSATNCQGCNIVSMSVLTVFERCHGGRGAGVLVPGALALLRVFECRVARN